jgi:hypothetical protein
LSAPGCCAPLHAFRCPTVLHYAKDGAVRAIDVSGPHFEAPRSVEEFARKDGFADALAMGRLLHVNHLVRMTTYRPRLDCDARHTAASAMGSCACEAGWRRNCCGRASVRDEIAAIVRVVHRSYQALGCTYASIVSSTQITSQTLHMIVSTFAA